MRKRCSVVIVLAVALAFTGIAGGGQKRPTTVAEIALYRGADRQQILEEGAKKEGKLVFYTTGVMTGSLGHFLELYKKKYPYVQLEQWRAGSSQLASKILEEYRAGKYSVDVIEGTQDAHLLLREQGILQPYSSPNFAYLDDGAVAKAPVEGAFSATFRLHGIGWAYNTKSMTKEEAPKSYQDLLDPKWRGKLTIAGGSIPMNWVGSLLNIYGEEYVKKLAQQNFTIHTISSRALLDLIISGEVPFSPTILDSHVRSSRGDGAPIDWVPLEPVLVNITQMALPKSSAHPCAAMLLLDLKFSKEAAEIEKSDGYIPTRKDVTVGRSYKKFYGAESLAEVMKWQKVYNTLFLKR